MAPAAPVTRIGLSPVDFIIMSPASGCIRSFVGATTGASTVRSSVAALELCAYPSAL
jgi:hypothetical protein